MPYRSEHALRLENPNKYQRYKRTSGGTIYGSLKVPKTIDIIWGHTNGEPLEAWHPQALRFPVMDWDKNEAKKWISKNIKNYISFDPSIYTKEQLKQKFSKQSDMNLEFRKLPIFKITPLESEFTEIAITEDPAIEEFFLKFSNEEIKMDFNADKQIITGPVMTPNKLIYRNDALGERFVTYDIEGIQKAASLFMKNGLKFNSEHTKGNIPIEILESYFSTTPNKFNVPDGSWIVSAKVNDLELWNKIKSNEFGFSVQSMFTNELVGMEELKFNSNTNEKMDLKEKLTAAINAVLFGETKEEMAATPEVVPAPEVVPEVAPVEQVTLEEVKKLIAETVSIAVEEIMKEVDNKIAECQTQMGDAKTATDTAVAEMSKQLQEFGKQPIVTPISETIINAPSTGYDYLKGVNLK